MNVLLLSPEYPPFSLGGVSVHASQIVDKLCNEETHNIVVLCWMNDMAKDDIDIEQSRNKIIVRINIYGKIPNNSSEENQFIIQNKLFRKGIDFLHAKGILHNIHLITVHSNFLADAAIYCKELLDVPMIYHAHTTYSFELIAKLGSAVKSNIVTFEALLCYKSDHIVAVSGYLKELITKYFSVSGDKISVIGKGVDINAYDNVDNPHLSDDCKILFVGRISGEKGIDVLLMALRLLTRKLNFLPHLYIVGSAIDKDYLKTIKDRISQLSLNKQVFFLGSKTQKDIIYEFKSCHMVVVPSFIETFGRVAIEAMAAKVPVIVSDVGGLGPLVTDKVNGLKFNPGDYVGLMQCMYYVIEHENVCNRMVQNAYSYVSRCYTIDKIFEQTKQLYLEIIESSNREVLSKA